MLPQSTFMVLAPIRAAAHDELEALLAQMNDRPGQADPENPLLPFARFDRLHVARFVILESNTADDLRLYGIEPQPWQPALAFLGDCDGSGRAFLAQLVEVAAPGLLRIFACCEDPPADERALLDWLQARNQAPQANYVNWIGRTVTQVREEAALHRTLAARLAVLQAAGEADDPRALRQKLLSHIEWEKAEGRLSLSPPPPTPRDWWLRDRLHLVGVPLLLLAASPLLLAILPLAAWRLRMLERADPLIAQRPDPAHLRRLAEREDHLVTNQFNVLGEVKPGPFRGLLLRFLLLLLDYAARHVYRRGFLTRVKSIHFARWVLIDGGRRLFFASNYDGSLESYMDDFINKVAWGLNLVFSNGVAYPPTRWLIKGGAEHEQLFKYTLRRHQLPSQVWYKANPDLSAFDMLRNGLIRQGVERRPRDDAALRAWLAMI
ncbi:MAG TPA: hypothetical protein ENJ94_08280 [Gammaproteobacteria bacterium]|nr:hypothetical protein [Gammaproteobacteria bacterium]